ncbi:MAG: FGGY-family carbohydrate kinase, partial [Candidatus Brocadiia bacterium]|nr:FGGY-family carbohydrate kinase [Candidatus Brocadiia bacterium]
MGLDIGTTGTKANVLSEDGRVIASAYREYPLEHPRPGWIELDADRVWQCVRQAVGEAAAGARKDPVRALAISTLGEAAVPVAADGTVLAASIIGFDNRASDLFDRWIRDQDPAEIMRITGQPPSQMFTIVKMMWIKRNEPDLYRRIHKYLTFGDFAHLKMGLEPRIDYSMAARTMAFDIHRKVWSESICEGAGISPELFSTAVPTGRIVGELGARAAEQLGLPPGCVVCAGSHDQPAGALGSGVTESGAAMDATGTVECFAVAMREPVVNETMLTNNLACYPHAAPGLYVSLAFNFTGGSLLRWVRDTFGEAERREADRRGVDVYEVLIEAMDDEPTDILVQPHFTMAGTPYMDTNPVGAILGLTLSTTRGQFLRAILEGISYELKLNLEILAQAGVEVTEFRAIGGGAKSDFWLQLKADMYRRPVVRLQVPEA